MGIFAVGVWSFRQAWVADRAKVIIGAVLGLLHAAIPSIQVLLMAAFVAALTGADSFDDVAAPFAGLVLLIAFSGPLEAVVSTLQWRVVDLIGLHAKQQVAHTLSTMPPSVLADPENAAMIEAGNKAAEDEIPFIYPQVAAVVMTTLSVVNGKKEFLGGAICPGIRLSQQALAAGTSQLPAIGLDPPERAIGRNTVECMKSGAIFGTAAMSGCKPSALSFSHARRGHRQAVLSQFGSGYSQLRRKYDHPDSASFCLAV